MCELFGLSLKYEDSIDKYLHSFFEHSIRHPHGWGVMYKKDQEFHIVKEPVRALDSSLLKTTMLDIPEQKNFLAHIRYATVGTQKHDNCHPFTGFDNSGRRWTIIHNGTIYSTDRLVKYLDKQIGDTDSERVFMYLMELVNEAIAKSGSLSAKNRFEIVEHMIMDLSDRNKLNIMIFDEELLYVHKNINDTLWQKKLENGYVFATSSLDEGWDEYPMCKVCAYKDGDRVFVGSRDTHEFVPTLEYINALAAMNI